MEGEWQASDDCPSPTPTAPSRIQTRVAIFVLDSPAHAATPSSLRRKRTRLKEPTSTRLDPPQQQPWISSTKKLGDASPMQTSVVSRFIHGLLTTTRTLPQSMDNCLRRHRSTQSFVRFVATSEINLTGQQSQAFKLSLKRASRGSACGRVRALTLAPGTKATPMPKEGGVDSPT